MAKKKPQKVEPKPRFSLLEIFAGIFLQSLAAIPSFFIIFLVFVSLSGLIFFFATIEFQQTFEDVVFKAVLPILLASIVFVQLHRWHKERGNFSVPENVVILVIFALYGEDYLVFFAIYSIAPIKVITP